MNVQALSLKVFVSGKLRFDPELLIPIFHEWIRVGKLPGRLLIDVADYRHVPDGPGVMIIGDGVHIGFDSGEGKPGIVYSMKRDQPGPIGTKLEDLFVSTLTVCKLLLAEPSLSGKISFRTDNMQLAVMSRLYAPNTEETLEAITPSLLRFSKRLYLDQEVRVKLVAPAPAPFSVTLEANESHAVDVLLGRLGPPLAAAV